MIPKWGKQPPPSLAPKFDELISILQSAQTFTSIGNPGMAKVNKKSLSNNNDYDDDEKKSMPSSTSTERYKTDLKGQETDTMKMILNEIKTKGLTSARLYRAPPSYYQEKIEWRRDVLNAPHINYLCKSLLMKNIRCTNNDCNDPTNSLYYLVIFVCK